MKGSRVWKIIWVSGVYLILFVILYLVVLYKVEWEDKDLNTYLYFYDCDRELCTSTTVPEDYYNKILCEDDVCPYITSIINKNVILKRNNISWIYNYIRDEIINNYYSEYRYLGDDIFVVTDSSKKQGVINLGGEKVVNLQYEYIDNYKNGYISYKVGNSYGVATSDGMVKVEPNYEKIVLINDRLYAGALNNKYRIYSYDDADYAYKDEYNYLASYHDIIFIINNKSIDILTTDLSSTLLMKINTFYDYTTEKERASLNLYSDGEYIYFNVFINENEYTSYRYDIASKKLA